MDDFNNENQLRTLLGTTPKLKEKRKSKSMNASVFASPNLTFVRKFRWTLEGNGLPEHWSTKLSVNFAKKELLLELLEVIDSTKEDIDVHAWLEKDLSKETLTLKTYDGCGYELYQYEFKDLELMDDKMSFDYASSEASTRTVVLKYKCCNRKTLYEKQKPKKPEIIGEFKKSNPPKKKFLFTTQIETLDGWLSHEFVTDVNARPNLNIEETEINYLSHKTWIPGKATWELITLGMDRDVGKTFVSNFSSIKDGSLFLCLRSVSGVKLETWKLIRARINSFKEVEDKDGDRYEIVVKYDNVEYQSHAQETNNESESCRKV